MNKLSASALRRPAVVCVLAGLCCLLWGSAFPAIKVGYALMGIASADTAEQLTFAGLRFFCAGVATVLGQSIARRRLVRPTRRTLPCVIRLGLVQTFAQYAMFYIGMAHTSGVKGSVLIAVNVFFAIIISARIFHYETLGAGKLLGCLCGFGGVVLINVAGSEVGGGFTVLGDGAILMAALASAVAVALFKRYTEVEDSTVLCGYQFLVGGGALLLLGLCCGGRLSGFTLPALLALLYMVLVSAVAQTVWNLLNKYNPVGRVAVYGFLTPVFGVILSALLLREGQQAFTWYSLVALLLVCVGILLVNRGDGTEKA